MEHSNILKNLRIWPLAPNEFAESAEYSPRQVSCTVTRFPAWAHDSLRGCSQGSAGQPVVVPAGVVAEPQRTQGQDRFDASVVPELLGAFDTRVELFDASLGQAAAEGPWVTAARPGANPSHAPEGEKEPSHARQRTPC